MAEMFCNDLDVQGLYTKQHLQDIAVVIQSHQVKVVNKLIHNGPHNLIPILYLVKNPSLKILLVQEIEFREE